MFTNQRIIKGEADLNLMLLKKEMSLRMKGNKHALGCKHTEEMNKKKSEDLKIAWTRYFQSLNKKI